HRFRNERLPQSRRVHDLVVARARKIDLVDAITGRDRHRPPRLPASRSRTIASDTFGLASARTAKGESDVGKALITNGTIVTAADTYKGDVLVDGEKSAMIGQGPKPAGATRTDATGKYVRRGGLD